MSLKIIIYEIPTVHLKVSSNLWKVWCFFLTWEAEADSFKDVMTMMLARRTARHNADTMSGTMVLYFMLNRWWTLFDWMLVRACLHFERRRNEKTHAQGDGTETLCEVYIFLADNEREI